MKQLLIIILIFTISCKKETTHPTENKITPEKNTADKVTDWDKFENEVSGTTDSIIKSDAKNRKKYLLHFLSFGDKVDGAIAEGYCSFAYEYVENNPKDFYSVLTENDSVLIGKWAEHSASEFYLIAENTKGIDSLWIDINDNHLQKRNDLSVSEIELDKTYLKKLKQSINSK